MKRVGVKCHISKGKGRGLGEGGDRNKISNKTLSMDETSECNSKCATIHDDREYISNNNFHLLNGFDDFQGVLTSIYVLKNSFCWHDRLCPLTSAIEI